MSRTNQRSHWGIESLVAELRHVRDRSLEHRQRREHPPKLPARKALAQIVEQVSAVLFPNRLGLPDLNEESIDYFVGHTLEHVLRELQRQVELELQFVAEESGKSIDAHAQSANIVARFAKQLPKIRILLDSDIQAAFEGDPAARSADEVLVCYPGITAIIHHRLAHELYQFGAPLVARIISEVAHTATGIDIHPGAQIGERFFIDHGTGVVIGETAVIGSGVRLYQAVTLGAKRFEKDEHGLLVKGNARHPIVEDQVVIYAGATILGRITLGQGSVIGGNVWLTHDIPPYSHVRQGQIHAEIISAENNHA
jgi:serine O-acetyltransferase